MSAFDGLAKNPRSERFKAHIRNNSAESDLRPASVVVIHPHKILGQLAEKEFQHFVEVSMGRNWTAQREAAIKSQARLSSTGIPDYQPREIATGYLSLRV
jgi:hypothetical protein